MKLGVGESSFRTTRIVLFLIMFLPLLCMTSDGGTVKRPNDEYLAFNETRHAIYNFIQNHEYLLTPLATMVAGTIRCGYWCGVVGGAVGVVDEFAVHLGYTDKHYLTYGIFGDAIGHIIKPALISDIGGVIAGVLLPTGMLHKHQEIIAPTVGIIVGNSMGGIFGMVSGAVGGIIDEKLLASNLVDRHYLTFAMLGIAVTNLLDHFDPFTASSMGIFLGFIAANYEDEIKDNILAPTRATDELYSIYSKFISKEQLGSHFEKHIIASIGSQFLTQFLSLKLVNFQQALTYNFERLDNFNGGAWVNLGKGIVNFAIFLVPYALGQTITSGIDGYFDKKLQFILEDRIRTELFSGEIPLNLSQDLNSAVLMDNLKTDISVVVNSGSSLTTGAVSTAINGAYGVGIIIIHSPHILIYSTLYNKIYTFITEYLASQQRFYEEQITALDSKLITTMRHDMENIRTIIERDGMVATKDKIENVTIHIRDLEGIQKSWSMVQQIWWSIMGPMDLMFNCYIAANEIQQKRIPFADRNKVQTASWQVSNLLSWSGRTAQDRSYMQQSLNRIVVLEGKIHKALEPVDKITRIIDDGRYLKFRELEVGIENRMLVKIEELDLELGKVYAITGESGCGKTSLLSKIKGVKENGVYGKGAIHYPKVNGMPRIVMLSQQDYFPQDASLSEIILYPDKIPSDPLSKAPRREEIQTLLAEIGLHAFSVSGEHDGVGALRKGKLDLDSKENWYTYLSGGEKKKVMVISAILKKPDLLILDEIFNGLDQKSTIVVQQMLKKYLPDTLILIVDHHAHDNNYDFYDEELKFTRNKLIALPLVD